MSMSVKNLITQFENLSTKQKTSGGACGNPSMSVKNLIAKFEGQSTMHIAQAGVTEKYLATQSWHQRFEKVVDTWERRCSNEVRSNQNVRNLIRFWQSRGA